MAQHKTYLKAAFKDKDEVKALGARWDADQKAWYAPAGADLALFRSWLPAAPTASAASDLGEVPQGSVPGGVVPATRGAELATTSSTGTDLELAKPKGIKLSQLLGGVANAVAEAFRAGVWTMVDVVDVRTKGGHVYLEVAERASDGVVTAKSMATIWASTAARILPAFEHATGAQIAPGIKLLLKLKPVFAPKYGLSLQVEAIDSEYTLGDLEARKREIRQRLQRDGIFELNKDLDPAWDYNAVLVIAPEGAAGLGDFQAEASRLEAAGICKFVYAHSRFQGEGAAANIRATLLKALDEWTGTAQGLAPDAAVIIRGGGAVNDLAWLNDYDLARSICEAPVPVLTGIGHERDSTILDEVAHTAFDTPSKVILGIEMIIRQRVKEARQAFEYVTGRALYIVQHCSQSTDNAHAQVKEAARQQMTLAQRHIEANLGYVRVGSLKAVRQAADVSRASFAGIETHARQQVADARQALPGLIETVKGQARASLREARVGSDTAMRSGLERASAIGASVREQTERAMADIAVDARRGLHEASTGAQALVREVTGQGAEKTLGRGFAIVRDGQGRTVTSASGADLGQHIEVQFRDGSVGAVIQQKG